MVYRNFLGIDPGLVNDPTAMVLIRATRPAVVVRAGKVLDAVTGEPVELPEGTTVAEFVSPRYDVLDVQSRQGLTFGQTAREARAVMDDMKGDLMAAVDATGLGRGAVDQIRQAGVPCIAVTLTAGSKITGSRWEMNLPVGLMFTTLYSVMAQGRLRVSAAAGGRLAAEMKEVERVVTEAGRESYEVPRGEGHHGDTVYALGIAMVVAERIGGRQARAVALHPEGRQRRPGVPRRENTARQVIRERLDASRRESEAHMWRQLWRDDDA